MAASLMTGCSATVNADPVSFDAAATTGTAPEGTASDGSTGPVDNEGYSDWLQSYAECMRSEGIDMPDPSGNAITLITGPDAESGTAVYADADSTCNSVLGAPPAHDVGPVMLSDFDQQKLQLQVAGCLRGLGFDVPDPERGAGLALPALTDAAESECLSDTSGPVFVEPTPLAVVPQR